MIKEKEEIDKLAKEKANELFEERLDFYMHKQGFDEGFNFALQKAIEVCKTDFDCTCDTGERTIKIIKLKIGGLKK